MGTLPRNLLNCMTYPNRPWPSPLGAIQASSYSIWPERRSVRKRLDLNGYPHIWRGIGKSLHPQIALPHSTPYQQWTWLSLFVYQTKVLMGPASGSSFLFAWESGLNQTQDSAPHGRGYWKLDLKPSLLHRFQHPQPVPVQGTSPQPVFSSFLEGPSGKP